MACSSSWVPDFVARLLNLARACQVTISNFLSPDGKWCDRANPTISVEGIVRREDRPFTLCRPIGAAVPDAILKRLNRDVELA